MGLCDNIIQKDIAVKCDSPFTSGVESEGIIINRADIDFAASTMHETLPNTLKSIVLKSGKKAYKVAQLGNNPFTGTNIALAVGTYRNTYTSTVSLVVNDNDPEVCGDVIDGLGNGSFVVILENKYKGIGLTDNEGSAAYQVFGWYQGLRASEITNDKYSEDTDGGWLVNLQETKSPKSAMFVYASSYEATKTMVDSLTADPA